VPIRDSDAEPQLLVDRLEDDAVAQPDQANALPQRLPLRLIVPAGAAVLAVALVAVLVVPALVGGGPAGTLGPVPGGSAAPAGSTTTTSTTVVVTCSTWARSWRDHCESLKLAAPAAPSTTSSPGGGGGATTTTVGTTPPQDQGQTLPTASATPSITTPSGSPSLSDDWTAVASEAAPAVVLVEAVGVATGTGFQVDSKGRVVTNRHVVAGASRFRVHTTGGRTLSAKLLGKSATHDIAVLQVKGLKARPLAWLAGKPRMGLGVLVLGFPGGPHAGHPLTATLGIVSGTGRNLGSGYKDMVQFDAPINGGNSGGPVLDSNGRVVAVATASAEPGNPDVHDYHPQNQNYGVLAADARDVVKRFAR
jgi:putative serine protease PepD